MIEREQWLQQLPALRAKIAATITADLFSPSLVNVFKQSRLPNGTYAIDASDLPLISSAKAIINMLYRIEVLARSLIDPTLAYYRAETLLQKATTGIMLAAKGGLIINDIWEVKNDINNLHYHLTTLNNTLKDVPHVNTTFNNLISTLKTTLSENLSPAFELIKSMQLDVADDPIESTVESEFILQKALNNVIPDRTKNITVLYELKSQTLAARTMLDKYIQTKLSINPNPNNHFYTINGAVNPKEHAILRTANALTHFYSALDKTSSLLKFKEFHPFDMIEELSLALNNLNLAIDNTKDFSIDELKNLLRQLFERIQPVLVAFIHQIETAELKLGLQNGVLQQKFNSLLNKYQVTAEKFGVSVEANLFQKEILATRKEAALQIDMEYKALNELKLTVDYAQPDETTSLYELLQLREDAKKIKTATTLAYSYGLKNIIEARTGLNHLHNLIRKKERALVDVSMPEPLVDELKALYQLRFKAEAQLQIIYATKDTEALFHVDLENRTIILDISLNGNETYLDHQTMRRSLEQLQFAKAQERTRIATLVVAAENQLIDKTQMSPAETQLRDDLMKLQLKDIHRMSIADIYRLKIQLEKYNINETYLLRGILNTVMEDKSGLSALTRELTSLQSTAQAEKDIHILRAAIHDISSLLKQKQPILRIQIDMLAQIMGTSTTNITKWIEESRQQSSYSFYDYVIVAKMKEHITLLETTDPAPPYPINNEARRDKLTQQIKDLQEKLKDGKALLTLDRDVYSGEGSEYFELAKLKALQAIHAAFLPHNRPLKIPSLPANTTSDFQTAYNADASPSDIYNHVSEKVKGPLILQSEKLRQQIKAPPGKILPSDPLLIKNLKSISETLVSFEKVVSHSQYHYERILYEGGLANYASLLTKGMTGLAALNNDLELKFNDMIFYLTEWKNHMPEQGPAYKALQEWVQPTLYALKHWAATANLPQLNTKIEAGLNLLIAPREIGPQQQYTSSLYHKVIDTLDRYIDIEVKEAATQKSLIQLRNALTTLGHTFFEMKKIATTDELKNYIRFLSHLSDLYDQFLALNLSGITQIKNDIKQFLEDSHKTLRELPGNLIVLEQEGGISSAKITETVNYKAAMVAFEKIGARFGMQIEDKYPYFKATIDVLEREKIRLSYQYDRLLELAGKFPDFDITTATAYEISALNLLPPSTRNIKTADDLQPYIKSYKEQIDKIDLKISTLSTQYQDGVSEHLKKLRAHLQTLELTLSLPAHSLQRFAYIEAASTHIQAKRVNDLSTSQGLLKLLIPNASKAYQKILAQPMDSRLMHQAIYEETQKHSSILGRLFRRLFSKPNLADQLFTLAKHMVDPEHSQRYQDDIQTEIKYMEQASLDRRSTTRDLGSSLKTTAAPQAKQVRNDSRFPFLLTSIGKKKPDQTHPDEPNNRPRNRKGL